MVLNKEIYEAFKRESLKLRDSAQKLLNLCVEKLCENPRSGTLMAIPLEEYIRICNPADKERKDIVSILKEDLDDIFNLTCRFEDGEDFEMLAVGFEYYAFENNVIYIKFTQHITEVLANLS